MQEHNILIVEDENIVAMDLSRRLTRLGYNVVGMATNGQRALELVESRCPDIILMDIHIKGNQDGIEVANTINELYQIPIIFLTAYSEDSTLARARQTRPYGYLLKPFSERELHVAIQVALERHQADQQLLKRETHLKLALDAARLGTWEIEGPNAPTILGYSPSGQLTLFKNWHHLHEQIIAADKGRVDEALSILRSSNDLELNIEFQARVTNEETRWYRLHGKSFHSAGQQQRVVGVLQDITEYHRNEEKLKQAATAFQCSADGIIMLDQEHRVESVNESFCRITGLRSQDIVGQELPFLSSETLGENTVEALWKALRQDGCWQGESSFHLPDNKLVHILVNIGSVPDLAQQRAQYVVVISDVTPMRDAQKKLSNIAFYDTLTGLPNRNLFMDRLDMCLAKAKRDSTRFGILFIDLDHFKQVNDTLGHQMGDQLLRNVALRMRSKLRGSDSICRIGGDEFIVIAETCSTQEELESLSRKIVNLMAKPVSLGEVEVVPGASIGICMYPDHATNKDEIIKMADTAMYAAKSAGRQGYAVYHQDMSEQVERSFLREQELHQALSHNEFRLYYQPQFNSQTGTLEGLEALLRWQHPQMGLLSPAEIIPVAECSQLIVDIGNWVLGEGCRQLRAWLNSGLQPPRLAVNVSARQLEDRNFAHVVSHLAECHQIPLSMLELEVTESCLQESDAGIHNLRRLRQLGIHISIDDFGTGYSCMNSLKTLPVTALKIDRSFVQDVHTNSRDRAIANAIIALARELQLKTIAEGIETEHQANIMREAGCDCFQGYLYCAPQPASEIQSRLNGEAGTHTFSTKRIAID